MVIAVIDSGVDPQHPDIAPNLSPRSTDIIPGRNALGGGDGHGQFVASLAAGAYNGVGSMGVAYAAEILAIRTDNEAGCGGQCTYRSADLALALDYAVANGARVVNLSIVGDNPLQTSFVDGLQRATDAGLVIAVAAGNDGGPEPTYPARYASDLRFAGSIIAVGALDGTGVLTSNRAGSAAQYFLAAPGGSTSAAAPYVAGSLALLLQSFPNLSGRDAVDILLRTARDLGQPGADAVYGRGALDLANAFRPVGSTSTPRPDGKALALRATPEAHASAFGDALGQNGALRTIIQDEYRRPFELDLAGGRARRILLPLSADALEPRPLHFHEQAPERAAAPTVAVMVAGNGRLRISAAASEGEAPLRSGPGGAFAAAAAAGRRLDASLSAGRWTLGARVALRRHALNSTTRRTEAEHVEPYLAFAGRSAAWKLSGGRLAEQGAPLTSGAGGTAFAASRTDHASFAGEWRPWRAVTLTGRVELGMTEAAGPLLALEDAASSAWTLGAAAECRLPAAPCTRVSLELLQPLRFEGGRVTGTLADPAAGAAPLTFSRRSVGAAPSGRELELRLSLSAVERAWGALRVSTGLIRQPGHRADAEPAHWLGGEWRRAF